MEATDKILKKAKKLYNQVQGERELGNEQAAQNMAVMLQNLLGKYRLSMSTVEQVDIDNTEDPIIRHEWFWSDHDGFDDKKKRCFWTEQLATIIAKAYGCRSFIYGKSNRIMFCGKMSAAKLCEYALVTLARAAIKESKREYTKFYQKCVKLDRKDLLLGFTKSWLIAFCNRIKERFEEEFVKPDNNEFALVLRNDRKDVDDYVYKNIRLRYLPRLQIRNHSNYDGHQAGTKFANSMNLHSKAVENSKTAKKYLS